MAALKSFGRVALLLFVVGTAFASAAYACTCQSGDVWCESLVKGGCTITDEGSCYCQ
jgi:hypothetical protein